jgi:hypothetical protein
MLSDWTHEEENEPQMNADERRSEVVKIPLYLRASVFICG